MAVWTTLDWLAGISWVTTGFTLLVALVGYTIWVREPWLNLPPGPPTIPIFGSAPLLVLYSFGFDIRKGFNRLISHYGDVYTLYLAMDRAVIINGYDAIKEAMTKYGAVLSGRPDIFAMKEMTYGGYGIIGTSGRVWQEQRRYTLHVLRDFGLGKNRMQETINDEIVCLKQELESQVGNTINIRLLLSKAINNIIGSIAFGKRYQYDDARFEKFMTVVADVVLQVGGPNILGMFPSLRFIPGVRTLIGHTKFARNLDQLYAHYRQWIDDHKERIENGEEPSDLIGSYLVEMRSRKDEENCTFSEMGLLGIVHDLFVAGTDSTSTMLSWIILYLVKYPDIQHKVQQEIHDVFGPDHVILWEERHKLPHTEAVIAEVVRMSSVIPLVAPHAPLEDVTFRGYHIPKGTMILMNTYSVDYDPNIWRKPEEFNPDRFLDEEGRYRRRNEQLTFGTVSGSKDIKDSFRKAIYRTTDLPNENGVSLY